MRPCPTLKTICMAFRSHSYRKVQKGRKFDDESLRAAQSLWFSLIIFPHVERCNLQKIFGFSSNYDRIPLSYCGTLCMAIGQEKERKVLDVISSEYIYICNRNEKSRGWEEDEGREEHFSQFFIAASWKFDELAAC